MVHIAVLLKIALAFWMGTPGYTPNLCPDGLKYNVKPLSEMYNHDPGTIAEAGYNSCTITLRSHWRRLDHYREDGRRIYSRYRGDEWACHVIIHEAGHAILGLRHSISNRDVMYPFDNSDTPGICRPYRGRWWRTHAAK